MTKRSLKTTLETSLGTAESGRRSSFVWTTSLKNSAHALRKRKGGWGSGREAFEKVMAEFRARHSAAQENGETP